MTDHAVETLTVAVERDIPWSPEKVWRALTEPHLIAEWLMRNDFSAVPGHRFNLTGDWGGVSCEVLVVEPLSRLSYTWNHPHEDPAFNLESVVTFTLRPTASGTLLRMEQVGFRPDQKQAYGGARYGWNEHLANLEKAVARLG